MQAYLCLRCFVHCALCIKKNEMILQSWLSPYAEWLTEGKKGLHTNVKPLSVFAIVLTYLYL